jgi:hypothetical protein
VFDTFYCQSKISGGRFGGLLQMVIGNTPYCLQHSCMLQTSLAYFLRNICAVTKWVWHALDGANVTRVKWVLRLNTAVYTDSLCNYCSIPHRCAHELYNFGFHLLYFHDTVWNIYNEMIYIQR